MKIELDYVKFDSDNIKILTIKRHRFIFQEYKVLSPANHQDAIHVDVEVDESDNLLSIKYSGRCNDLNKEKFIRIFSNELSKLGVKHNLTIQTKLNIEECIKLDD